MGGGRHLVSEIIDPELDATIRALEKDADCRTDSEINKIIIPLIRNITFFQKEDIAMTNEEFRFIAERIKFGFFEEGENVITYGDRGDKFFILIKGELNVLIPNSRS